MSNPAEQHTATAPEIAQHIAVQSRLTSALKSVSVKLHATALGKEEAAVSPSSAAAAHEPTLQEALQAIAALTSKVGNLEKQLAALQATPPQTQPYHGETLSPPASLPSSLPNPSFAGHEAAFGPHSDEAVSMGATRVVMHQIVLPSETDALGICFGGQVLSWIDICAGLAAKTVAKGPVVTASLDAVHFLEPCRLGGVAIIAAMVNRTFASSMEVGVRVEEEELKTGERHHCCSAYLTFVSVRARSGRKLPRIIPSAGVFQDNFNAADRRRADRLAARSVLQGDPEAVVPRLQPVTHREGSPTLAPAIQVDRRSAALKARVEPSATLSHMTQLIMPQHANSLAITFGGQVMSWMEQCAYIAASRLGRGSYMLTASMDSIAFVKPTRVGDIIYITSQVTGVFGSSMEVMVSVCGETPTVGEVFHCGDAYVTVVSVDEKGGPVDVPCELAAVEPHDVKRCAQAAERRRQRLGMRSALAVNQASRRSLDGSMSRNLRHTRQQPVQAALERLSSLDAVSE